MSTAEYVYNYFLEKGYSPQAAAGITGNLSVESNFNTKAIGDKGTAFGIAQWRNDRVTKFQELFGKHVKDATLNEQLAFVDWELNNTETNALFRLRESKTVADATNSFMKLYERPNENYAHYDRRLAAANSVYGDQSVFGKAKSFMGSVLNQLQIPGLPGVRVGDVANGVNAATKAGEEAGEALFGWIPRGVAILVGIILIALAIAAVVLKDNPVTEIVSKVGVK